MVEATSKTKPKTPNNKSPDDIKTIPIKYIADPKKVIWLGVNSNIKNIFVKYIENSLTVNPKKLCVFFEGPES